MNRDPGAARVGVLSPGLSAGAGGASVVVDAGVVVAVDDGCARVCGAAAVVLEVGGDEIDDDRDGGAGEE
jgi:hypothetical protein